MAAASLLALAASANAADLPARTYTKAPVVSPAYNWSGFYIGAMGGYAWSDEVTGGIVGFGNTTISSSEFKGGFGGGTIGYNWQVGPSWVLGIEVDAAGAGIKYAETAFGTTVQTKINALGSVTGRAGFAIDNVLIYGKGGFAWANNELSGSTLGFTASDSQFHTGWTAGGGVEWGFSPNWSAKVEYMFADFDTQTYFNAINLGATLHTVKGGVNYRF